jgi:hypothetical protein
LILFKLLAGRPRDLLDIKDILFMQGQLDEAYMRRWAMPLGVAGQLERRRRVAHLAQPPLVIATRHSTGFGRALVAATSVSSPSSRNRSRSGRF